MYADSEAESPTSLLWTLSYLAQHFDHLRQTDLALEYINAALEHTMTLIELYVIKARIYKVSRLSNLPCEGSGSCGFLLE